MTQLLTEADYTRAAAQIGCEVAAIKAVAEVESRGDGFLADGRPKVLFEGQYFYKFTRGAFAASHPTLCYQKWVTTHYLGGAAEWDRRLAVAMTLDREAAIKSASFGKFQVMAFNFADAFASVDEFYHAMHESEGRHLDAFLGYVRANNLARFIRARDWAAFALGYNGPGYAANHYDTLLAAAYRKHAGMPAVAAPSAQVVLIPGMRGEVVRAMQARLIRAGYTLEADGDFGAHTRAIVMDFQASRGLVADGIVGERTQLALAA